LISRFSFVSILFRSLQVTFSKLFKKKKKKKKKRGKKKKKEKKKKREKKKKNGAEKL